MVKKLESKLKKLPTSPGVYFHKSADGEVIYIGKAANLRNRVRQYFQKSRTRDLKTDALLSEIRDLDWRELDSEVDALFLEAELVRRYQPRYNILLRDDKSALFVRIDYKSDYPTVTTVRRPLDDGAEYFGPYLSGFAVKKALRYLRRAFPYATSRPTAQKRVSLHYHLGLDPGLEDGRTTLVEYRANLRKLMQYLRGQRVKIVREIEREMKRAAADQDFELAAALRNQLRALQQLARQSLFGDKERLDASADQALVDLAELLGIYDDPQVTHSDEVQGDKGVTSDKSGEASLIISQLTTPGEQRTEDVRNGTSKEQPQPATPQLAESPDGVSGSARKQGRTLRKLRRIEGFDISHIQGTDTVASMVVFINGVPDKTSYRKFKMRLPGNDDVAHISETLKRRLREENRRKWGLADLILIDGGKGQLRAALGVRDQAGLAHLPTIGLAKREEQIVVHKSASVPGATIEAIIKRARAMDAYVTASGDFVTILLPDQTHIVKLLQRIRDESHRFAVSYHSTLRAGRQTASLLDEIPGIGPATRKKLIRHFGSTKAVVAAKPDELQAAVGRRKGASLAQYLKGLK